MKHITLLVLPGTHGQFSNLFPRGRQKVKLIIIPAGKKTIQRHFAGSRGTLFSQDSCNMPPSCHIKCRRDVFAGNVHRGQPRVFYDGLFDV